MCRGSTYFSIVYIAAIALGIVSNSPGGLGVFRGHADFRTWGGGRSDVLAALLLYRLIYTLLPFVIASTALGILWVLTQK